MYLGDFYQRLNHLRPETFYMSNAKKKLNTDLTIKHRILFLKIG